MDILHLQQPVVPKRGVLVWIAIYKIGKAVLTLIAGLAMLRLRHHDLTQLIVDAVHHLGLAPDSRLATHLIARAAGIHDQQLGEISAGLFLYATLYFVEGIGLYYEKAWAEWLIVISSCLLLPLEIYELFHRPHWLKVVVLITNLVIIGYLIWRIKREERLREVGRMPDGDAA